MPQQVLDAPRRLASGVGASLSVQRSDFGGRKVGLRCLGAELFGEAGASVRLRGHPSATPARRALARVTAAAGSCATPSEARGAHASRRHSSVDARTEPFCETSLLPKLGNTAAQQALHFDRGAWKWECHALEATALMLSFTGKVATWHVSTAGVTSMTLARLLAMELLESMAAFAGSHAAWECELGMVSETD